MKEIHEILFNLLIEIDDICSEYGIDYYLAGGTSLGAIRNKCFLPWDDDIDLFILRDHWRKFYKLIEENPEILPENRRLVCNENDEYHRNPIARYVDATTTAIFPAQSLSGKTCGDQIEFFILDPIPNVEDGQEQHLKEMQAFLEVLSPNFFVSKDVLLEDFPEIRELVLGHYAEIEKRGFSKVMQEIYEKLYTYPLKKADTLRLRWGVHMVLLKSEYYSQPRYVELEGRKFPVANGLEKVFRVEYGDSWMYIPVVKEQVFHTPLVEDLNHPFDEFTEIYLSHVNQADVLRAYDENKKHEVEFWLENKDIDVERNKIKGYLERKNLLKIIELNNYDLNQLLEDGEFELIDEIFGCYLIRQFDNIPKRYKVLIDLGDDLYKILLASKIKQGLYFSARNLLDIIEYNRPLGEDLQHLKDICEYCRTLSYAIYDDCDVGAVEDALKNVFDDCKDLIDTYRATLWLMSKKASDNSDYGEIIRKGHEMISQYPSDGELMAYVAEAYYRLGDMEKATEMYDCAVHHTRNGFVWQNAKEHVGIDRMEEEARYVESLPIK